MQIVVFLMEIQGLTVESVWVDLVLFLLMIWKI